MEVRCCCNPKKLLGSIEADPSVLVNRYKITRRCRVNAWKPEDPVMDMDFIVELPVGAYYEPESSGHPYLVLKSNDVPIEVLRTLPSFEEAL